MGLVHIGVVSWWVLHMSGWRHSRLASWQGLHSMLGWHQGGVMAGRVCCNRVEVMVDLHVVKSEEVATTGSQVARWRWQQGLASLRRHRVRDHVVERGGSLRTRHVGERLLKDSAMLVRNEMKKIKKTYLHCVPANGIAGNCGSGCGG